MYGTRGFNTKKQVEQIKASIREFEFNNPILTGLGCVVIASHGRLRASKELHFVEVPTIKLEGLSGEPKRLLRLADNKIVLSANWDMEILKVEFAGLSAAQLNCDLLLTGFSTGEIDVILADDVDPDDEIIPALPNEPFARLSDIWEIGIHCIGCGDGRDVSFLEK